MHLLTTIILFFALLYTYKSIYYYIDSCMYYMKHKSKNFNGMFLVMEDYICIFFWSLFYYLNT